MVDPATGEYLGLLVENAGGLGNATNHMALGPDGHLYLTEWRLDVVLKFDGTTGAYVGTVAAGIERASGVAFDEQGIGYVGEYYTISAVRDAVWSFTTSGAGTHRIVREFMQHGPQSLTIGPDGRIHVGDKVSVRVYDRLTGERTALLSAPSGAGNFFALLFMPEGTSCYADCSGDGALNLADFGCFQTKFATGDPYADCNADGVLNVADFGCFQTRFAQACP